MADLIGFLHTLRYFEPGGSPPVGEMLFAIRGCGECHGARGEGTSLGPGIRGRGVVFSSVSLATSLWRHGPAMYQRAREHRHPWPMLKESDVGDLVVFLNSAAESPGAGHRAP